MSQSHANTWIQRLHPVLNHALADPERLPARPADDLAARRTTPPSEASAPSPPFVPDGTERPIQRPKDPEEQQDSDRGKKTCHTLNNLLLIKETAPVCFLSHPCAGKASDKSLAERAGYPLPPGSCLYQDKLDFVHFCDLS
jgi:DDE superfamily endonuclease